MDFHIGQSSHPGICQAVAAFLFGVSPLHAGASVIFLLPDIASSGDRAYQAIISIGVKGEGLSIERQGASSAEETRAFAL